MKIISFPRIHVALADLAGATSRRFGGAGFAIEAPQTIVDFRHGNGHGLLLPEGIESVTVTQLRSLCERMRPLADDVQITVEKMPPQHSGLGSKTALLLAVATGLYRIKARSARRVELQRISGRGGASGIGVNTFFDGGFLTDGGHAEGVGSPPFLPSSASDGHTPPPVIARHPIPLEWKFTLIVPLGRNYSGSDEIEFFRLHAPILKRDALATIGLLYHGVAAAVATCDLPLLTRSLVDLHTVGFKRKELEGQSARVRELLRSLQANSLAAGMSSMGPLLYVVTRTDAERDLATSLAAQNGSPALGTFSGRNSGFEVLDD